MKKELFIAIITTIIIPCSLFSSCRDDEADPLLDTSVSPDYCHAIFIARVEEGYAFARIHEDTLMFCDIYFPTSDLQGLSIVAGDFIDVRFLTVHKLPVGDGISIPERALIRRCHVALCE